MRKVRFRPEFLLIISFIFSGNLVLYSQSNNPFTGSSQNFYEIKAQFEKKLAEASDLEHFREWKQYKRWEWFMEPRVFPTGELPNPMAVSNELSKPKPYRNDGYRSSGSWVSLGPDISSGNGIGRINFICFHPTDSNIIFAGAPSGGLWKTTNGGTSWTTNTDNLPVIGFSDMVINPQNPAVMYLASSDGDANDTYSIGVLKSTDGGQTWVVTGLNFNVTQTRTIRKLLMHPSNPDILYAATNNGIYKTVNAGNNWTRVYSYGCIDIEFKPQNPSVIYAAVYQGSWTAGAKFIRSTDNGSTWKEITGDWSGKANRIAIAIAPGDSNYVYIIASESPTSNYDNRHGYLGFYRSVNGADSFVTMSTSPNILGWSPGGTDQRGQGWYDLEVVVSPVNRHLVFIGGINIWKSEDGGATWTLSAHWYGGGGAPYVHADIHAMAFDPKNPYALYIGCDGGIYYTKNGGVTYKDISQSMVTSQIYRIGSSATDNKLVIAGLQDNGSKLYNGSWGNVLGGDGMECIIDPTDNKIMYGSLYYGDIQKSTNGGSSFNKIKKNIDEDGGWVTPYLLCPKDPKILYAGYNNVWVNYNRGSSNWIKISSFAGSTTLVALAVAPSDTSVIYAAKSSTLYRTRNSGQTWDNINSGLPTANASITDIEVREDNANVVWVTFSGYSNGNKVFVSVDGGDNWVNYSGSLPNLPVNCIVYQKGSDNGLYVGTDVGVYYRDSSLNDWIPFSSGLPNVIVNDLEIFYNSVPSKQRIKAATYGRGLWESELYASPDIPPVADFEVKDTVVCPGYTVSFNNLSSYATSFRWYFPGANPSVSTDRNPKIRFESPGYYDVYLVAINDYGKDSIRRTALIRVDATAKCIYIMPSTFSNDVYTTCTGTLFDPGGNSNYTSNLNTIVTISPPQSTGIIMTFKSFQTEDKFDVLEIFEGTSVSGKRIGAFSGSTLPGNGLIVSQEGSVTLRFTSDALDNRSGFEMEWKCIKPDEPPFAYFSVTNKYSCTGEINFENRSLNNPVSYLWDFGDGSSSSEINPVHQYQKNGKYNIKLKISNAHGSDSFTITNLVVDMPLPPKVNHGSSCGAGQVSLSAYGDGHLYWYNSLADSIPFHKGSGYQTSFLTETKDYYVRLFTFGPSQYAGPYSNSIGSGGFLTGTQGLLFNVYKNLIIRSVKVYASGSGNRQIQLKNSSGSILYDTNVYLNSGENRINLNFEVEKGNAYSLIGINATLYRNNAGVSYPYTIENLISIYNSTAGSTVYYYFYDWEIQESDVCRSLPVKITAGIFQQAPKAGFDAKDSGLYVKFNNLSTNNLINNWSFGDGNTSDEVSPVYKYSAPGNYTVKLSTHNACGSDSVSKNILIVNSLNEYSVPDIRVYPNPSEGKFTVELSHSSGKLKITDVNGKVVAEEILDGTGRSIFFTYQLKRGIYFLSLIDENGILTRKIIIY
ncbi:MAG: PKD domain-containing protein [Sphingobacteriales bacterium]|nr:PKD domain-containing protein [Sphingobacteriales bacterium]